MTIMAARQCLLLSATLLCSAALTAAQSSSDSNSTAAYLASVAAQANSTQTGPFASWNSSNKADTQWYIPIHPPKPGGAEDQVANYGVQILPVWAGYTPTPASNYTLAPPFTSGVTSGRKNPEYETDSNNSPRTQQNFNNPQVYGEAVWYGNDSSPGSENVFLPASIAGLYVGNYASFTTSRLITNSTSSTIQNTTWSSLPYGLAIGMPRSNGSVVFGGMYDWNRVNDTKWHKLPPTIEASGGMSDDGAYRYRDYSIQVGTPINSSAQKVTMNVNSGTFKVPGQEYESDLMCGGNINITMAGASIDIDHTLLETRADCEVDYIAQDETDGIVLGLPFFENAYVYFDADGSVYVARALASNATVALRKFDPTASIETHPGTQYTGPGAQSQTQSGAGNAQIPTSGVAAMVVVLAGISALIAVA